MAHVHHHGPQPQVSPGVRRLIAILVAPIVVLTIVGVIALRSEPGKVKADLSLGQAVDNANGEVVSVLNSGCDGSSGFGVTCQSVEAKVTSGPGKGDVARFDYQVFASNNELKVGDDIVLAAFSDPSQPDSETVQYSFVDYQRKLPLVALTLLFLVAVIALGRMRGLRALIALALSLGMLVWFTIPSIVAGHSPLAVSIVTSVAVMLVVLYLTDGLNARASTAVLGTVLSLGLIAVLAYIFVGLTHLTGLASEEAGFIQAANDSINIQGLLLGGFIIGALGVLDDMTVTQVSAVWELHQANPQLGLRGLYKAAERIGRDHIASTVNTLVLAYAGASLPLLILFTQSNRSLSQVLQGEIVAVEIVRTLVGSIGLVASVPITTALAAVVVTSGERTAGRWWWPARAESAEIQA